MASSALRAAALIGASALVCTAASPIMARPAPDHAEQLARLAAFEANLAAHASATEALAQWCRTMRTAPDGGAGVVPPIRAELVAGAPLLPPRDLRARLAVAGDARLGYRHVRLSCDGTVLSEAHNWFVPALLTEAMNRTLATTDTPFGRVAAPLQFSREPLETRRGRARPCPAGTVSTHRALLRLPDGRPLALVEECYTVAVLAR